MMIGVSGTAEASIISAMSGVFGTQVQAADDGLTPNSQKMSLLEAPMNPTVSTTVDSSVALIDDNALVSQPEILTKAEVSSPVIPENNSITTYTVKSGDTVSGIAKKFNISVNTVIWANSLKKDSMLTVGKTLVILPISGVKHVVKKGDNLQSIALQYKGNLQEVLAYNDLAVDDSLKIGEVIVVPDGEITSKAASTLAANTTKTPAKTSVAKKVASVAIGVGIASADNAPSSGYYTRPIKAGVRTQGLHGNNGVDLADSCGTSLYAAAAGTVVIAKENGAYNGGYGNYVVLSHSNGSQTLYAHMQTVAIGEGSQVTKGQYIGTVGATGKVYGATGCHVHFEVRNGPSNPF